MGDIYIFDKIRKSNGRSGYEFVNKDVRLKCSDRDWTDTYPCIVLRRKKDKQRVSYTKYEKYITKLTGYTKNSGSTLSRKAKEVCTFLNYILHETNIDSINEVTLNDIRNFMIFAKTKKNGGECRPDTWHKKMNSVLTFLRNYYDAYCEEYEFAYDGDKLQDTQIATDRESRMRIKVVKNTNLNVSAPKSNNKKKNRTLVYGHLDLLLFEAKKHDPMLVLPIALQSYAGLREGEDMNVTCGSLMFSHGAFGSILNVEINLLKEAPFWKDYSKKCQPPSFKKNQYRIQKVYDVFAESVQKYYEEHLLLLEAQGYSTDNDAPLFLNLYGKPMTTHTYASRVKKLFYKHFLPTLKAIREKQGNKAEELANIEAYEEDYPGAHMFRHWFTMYLITKAKLEYAEVMKWRNDHDANSMLDYIRENAEMIDAYKNSVYRFQKDLLEDINAKYGEKPTE